MLFENFNGHQIDLWRAHELVLRWEKKKAPNGKQHKETSRIISSRGRE